MSRREWGSFAGALIAHLLLGAFLLGWARRPSSWHPPLQRPPNLPALQTRVLSERDFERENEPEDSRHKQFVQTEAAPKPLKIDKKTDYLSGRTQRVEREQQTSFFGSTQSASSSSSPGQAPADRHVDPTTREKKRRDRRLEKLGFSTTLSSKMRQSSEAKMRAQESKKEAGQKPSLLSRGSADLLRPDIAIGASTLLNTDYYLYASFYQHFQDELMTRWYPLIREAHRALKSALKEGNYRTVVVIVLDREGNVDEVRVVRSSGVKLFDEALRTAAQNLLRLENPPLPLKGADGKFRIYFPMTVPIGRGSRFHIEIMNNGSGL